MQRAHSFLLILVILIGFNVSAQEPKESWEHTWNNESISISEGIQFFWEQEVQDKPSTTVFENGIIANVRPWIKQENIAKYTGYGTYYIEVNGLNPTKEYALQIDLIYCEYRVWVNDELLIEVGKFASIPLGDQYDYGAELMRVGAPNGVAKIHIEVANFSNRKGGIIKPLIFGEHEALQDDLVQGGVITIVLVGITVAVALYSLLLFFFTKYDRSRFFYFALLCLSASARTLCINTVPIKLVLPDISDFFVHACRYLGFFLGVLGAVYYFTSSDKTANFKRFRYGVLFLVTAASMVVLFAPRFYHSFVSLAIQLLAMTIIIPSVIFQIRSIRRGEKEQYIHLFGLLLFTVIFVHELLAANNWIPSYFYQSIGILMFALSHMAYLVYERQHIYKNLDESEKGVEQLSAFSKSKIDLNESLIEQLNSIDADLSPEEKDARIQQLLKDAKRVRIAQQQMTTEQIDPSNEAFLKRLAEKYPDLADTEKQLCIYLRANLSNKRIAEIKGIAPESVKRSKTRLRKKMSLKQGQNISEVLSDI